MGLGLKKILQNFIFTLSRQLIVVLAQLLFVIFVARVLGPEGNGQLSLALLVPQLLVMLFNLGLPAANVYYVAKGDIPIEPAVKANLKFWLYLSVIGSVLAILIINYFGSVLFPSVPENALMGAIAIFPLALFFTLFISLLQSQQKFKAYNLIFMIPATLTLALSVLIVWWFDMGVVGALLSWASGQLVGAISLFLYYKKLIFGNKERDAVNYVKEGVKYGWKAHLANIIAFLNYRADLFLINLFIGPIGAGIYAVAVQIAERLWMLSQAVSTILFPKLSELNNDREKQKQITPIVARWMLYAGILVAVVLAFVVEPVIALLFGDAYFDAAFVLILLLPGIVLMNYARVLAHDISARGKPQYNMYASLAGFTVNVICNVILIPKYGVNGAAVATVVSYIVISLIIFVNYLGFSENTWKSLVCLQKQDITYAKKMVSEMGAKMGFRKK